MQFTALSEITEKNVDDTRIDSECRLTLTKTKIKPMPLRTIKNGDSWPASIRAGKTISNQAPVAGPAQVLSVQCGGASRAKPTNQGTNLQPIDADAPPKPRPSRGPSDRELVAELPVETAEGFRQRFGRAPYFTENQHYEVSGKQILSMLDGELPTPLFTDEEKSLLLSLHEKSRELSAKISACGISAVHQKISVTMRENEAAIAAGEPPPHKRLNKERMLEDLEFERRSLRDEGRALSIQAFNVWNKKVDVVKSVARNLVVDLDLSERSTAEGRGMPFEPSSFLRWLCYVALVSCETQRSAWATSSCGFNKKNILWGILADDEQA